MINIQSILPFLSGVVIIFTGLFVLLKNPKSKLNILFFLDCLALFVWLFGYSKMYATSEKEIAFRWARLGFVGIIFIPVFIFHFYLSFLRLQKRLLIFLIYSLSAFFLVISQTSLIYRRLDKYFWGWYPRAGIIYPFFVLFFFAIFIYSLILLYVSLKETRAKSASQYNQLKYLLVAFFVASFGGVDYIAKFGIKVYPFGYLAGLGWILIVAFAILKYRLMDIRIAITKFGIFAVVYTLVLGVPFWLGYKYYLWQHSTWLMLILATLGPSIYMRLEKRSKALLYKTELRRYETLRKFSKTLLLIKELDKLVELIVYRLVKTLKVTYAGIYLYDKEKDAYVLKSYRPLKYSGAPKVEVLTKNDFLIKLLFIWQRELIREEVPNLPLIKKMGNNHIDLTFVQNEMREISATLIIPHFVENDLLGFLVLGDKEKNAIYTEEDVSILSALSNSAALAIENALFLIDLKITQAELFNAKRIAELGYMASAMGHEINNRLQAIYSAGFDMVDNPVVSDLIKNNPQAKEIFDRDIKHINENIDDATAIINELKTYARPQEHTKQNLEPLNLKDIIDKALTVVRLQSVKAFDAVDLDIKIPEDPPKILGNFIQLQQVFVNILNNAHDAILEKQNYISTHPELNLSGYKGKIQLIATEVKNTLDIHIIDNGIGMTEEIKKRLFIPLYTSKASADRKTQRGIRGGTGIGLYTIQTIIRGHNGAISVYETERLKGTDFLITLPVAREKGVK